MILPFLIAITEAHSDSVQVSAGVNSCEDRNNHNAMLRAANEHFESQKEKSWFFVSTDKVGRNIHTGVKCSCSAAGHSEVEGED